MITFDELPPTVKQTECRPKLLHESEELKSNGLELNFSNEILEFPFPNTGIGKVRLSSGFDVELKF